MNTPNSAPVAAEVIEQPSADDDEAADIVQDIAESLDRIATVLERIAAASGVK